MFHALYASFFKKHGEEWIFFVLSESNIPTRELLQKTDGIIIPGSTLHAENDSHVLTEIVSLIKDVHSDFPKIKLLGVCFGA